jgi:hypothetical protein
LIWKSASFPDGFFQKALKFSVVLGKNERKKVVDSCGLERVAMTDDRLTYIISSLCGILILLGLGNPTRNPKVNFIRKQNGVLKVSNPW